MFSFYVKQSNWSLVSIIFWLHLGSSIRDMVTKFEARAIEHIVFLFNWLHIAATYPDGPAPESERV